MLLLDMTDNNIDLLLHIAQSLLHQRLMGEWTEL